MRAAARSSWHALPTLHRLLRLPANMPDSSHELYTEALEFLYGRINYEQTTTVPYRARELNLGRMRWLMDCLGNPHLRTPIIHLAGTKGKGSTAAMISSILVAAGYRVGLYTSPHLARLEERFAVNGEPCTSQEIVELTRIMREVLPTRESVNGGSEARLTFFDITTAMGFLHFQKRKVDVIVLEVGMGGRLDSTNICHPLVSVITSISFDHTKQLGTTLAAIANEKAGIIKSGVPVVSGVTESEPAAVIAQVAADRGSQLFQRERDFFVDYQPPTGGGPGRVSFRESPELSNWKLDGVPLGMLGKHQAMNAGVALATVGRLRATGWPITDDHCCRGLETAHCPGRIEVVSHQPTIVIDTAHNEASIQALLDTFQEGFTSRHRVLIFAVARDKDVSAMLRLLLPQFDHIILTQFQSNPRGLPCTELADLAETVAGELSIPTAALHLATTPGEAWKKWSQLATADSLLCITGSFFLAAEMMLEMPNRQRREESHASP